MDKLKKAATKIGLRRNRPRREEEDDDEQLVQHPQLEWAARVTHFPRGSVLFPQQDAGTIGNLRVTNPGPEDAEENLGEGSSAPLPPPIPGPFIHSPPMPDEGEPDDASDSEEEEAPGLTVRNMDSDQASVYSIGSDDEVVIMPDPDLLDDTQSLAPGETSDDPEEPSARSQPLPRWARGNGKNARLHLATQAMQSGGEPPLPQRATPQPQPQPATAPGPLNPPLGPTDWLLDQHIDQVIDQMERWLEAENPEIAAVTRFIPTSFVQLLRLGGDSDDVIANFIVPQNLDVRPTRYLFVPVNNAGPNGGGSHWSLLFIDRGNPAGRSILHYDSAGDDGEKTGGGANEEAAFTLATRFISFESARERGRTQMAYRRGRIAQQRNSFDCGVFMLEAMRELTERLAHGHLPTNGTDPDLRMIEADREALNQRLMDGQQDGAGPSNR